ncbi:MAG TPA: hypothetical protein VG456_10225 [Candidatus Sulfopaludibacter sp.]|nr:hypothetical protein [Candidatus Sulfopaludibacter sp.]
MKTLLIFTLTAAGLLGQTAAEQNQVQEKLRAEANFLQQVSTMGGGVVRINAISALVTGSPVSAKQVNRTVQTLSDGTEIENTDTTLFYRDAQGRTRTEPAGENGVAIIQDPVSGQRIRLNAASRTATRMPVATAGGGIARGGMVTAMPAMKESLDTLNAQMKVQAEGRVMTTTGTKSQAVTEDLGFQMQNGVLAQGTRSTLVIPKGQIGNNREIHVVNERWYSKDLQMVVKTVNSDPRFGTTTFDLTNIVQAADPSLFQIPGNYTVTEGMGRGGVPVMK